MIINTVTDGRVLYQGAQENIKEALQFCLSQKINLSAADLRKSDLSEGCLDGLQAIQSCFWGANFKGADLSESNLEGSDFRLSNFEQTCLADANLKNSDFRGASFQNTILDNAGISGSQFSCLTFLRQDLRFVRDMTGCVFHHRGEVSFSMSKPPIYLRTPLSEIFILDEYAIIDDAFFERCALPSSIQALFHLGATTPHKNTSHG